MKIKNPLNALVRMLPVLLFTSVLLGLLVVRITAGMVLPVWGRWVLGLCWGVMAFDYLVRAELFKQIGGFAVALLTVCILFGALIPQEKVARYPRIASEQLVQNIGEGWNAVYTGNILKHHSPQQSLIGYGTSLSNLDPFRHGKMILFGLLGFLLGVVYLFPVDPGRSLRRYLHRFMVLFWAGVVFAIQAELLQVLSPTRLVTALSVLDSALGLLIGLILFLPIHRFYEFLAEYRAKGSARFNVLGVGVDAVNMDECIARFAQFIENSTDRPVMTSALGVAGIIEARRNPRMQRILNESVLNTPDGMPLVWLGRLFGYRDIDRVYGPDLLREVCRHSSSKGWKHFFYGAAPGVVEKLKERLETKYQGIQIAGIYCPPFRDLTLDEEDDVVERVNRSGADIFWIGISTPKQLYFMDHIRSRLKCKIICPVGYAFDVNAGVQEDAPDWAKYSGFQWLHRAIKQPRLWKRYLPDNPRFVFETTLQILRLKRYPMFLHERPFVPFQDAEGYPRFPAGVVSLSAMTLTGARDRILNWVKTGQKHYVNICTADTMVQCFDRPDMAKIVNSAGMATTDGMPLVWLARHYGFKDVTRVYGPDLMLALCEATEKESSDGRKISHFFYGATDEVLAQLKTNLQTKFPGLEIAGMYSPPFRPLNPDEKDAVTTMINASGADIVWCGLGTPKQDYWVAEFRPRLNCSAILAVGAAFNFHAGHVRQAPRWMMKGGLEWLFRLAVEPKRLWKRYIIGNPRFILLVAGLLMRRWRVEKS